MPVRRYGGHCLPARECKQEGGSSSPRWRWRILWSGGGRSVGERAGAASGVVTGGELLSWVIVVRAGR